MRHPIIVIDTPADALGALRTLIAGLPRTLPAAVFVVLHGDACPVSELVAHRGALPMSLALDAQEIRPGHVYLAPADHHVLVGHGVIQLARGGPEIAAQPAVNALFRSAAEAYGRDVIGVALADPFGAAADGLGAIRDAGGVTVSQGPARGGAPVDHAVALSELPGLLCRLCERHEPDVPLVARLAASSHAG